MWRRHRYPRISPKDPCIKIPSGRLERQSELACHGEAPMKLKDVDNLVCLSLNPHRCLAPKSCSLIRFNREFFGFAVISIHQKAIRLGFPEVRIELIEPQKIVVRAIFDNAAFVKDE